MVNSARAVHVVMNGLSDLRMVSSQHMMRHLERASASCDNAHVVQVCEVDLWQGGEIAEECNISIGSCYDILTTKLEKHQVVSKFVRWLLTEDLRDSRIAICQELWIALARMKSEKNYNRRWNMGLWIWCGNKNTVFIMGWKNSLRPKKAQQVMSSMKDMLTLNS
jgi:hypothetical protein